MYKRHVTCEWTDNVKNEIEQSKLLSSAWGLYLKIIIGDIIKENEGHTLKGKWPVRPSNLVNAHPIEQVLNLRDMTSVARPRNICDQTPHST